MVRDGWGLAAMGTTAMSRISDGASARWGTMAMERNGWGLAAMGATAMGRDGWGLTAMGCDGDGADCLKAVGA
jgi:hypothetical protein